MTNEPRYLVVYRESDRLAAEAAGQETVKVVAWGGPIPECIQPTVNALRLARLTLESGAPED